MGKTIKNNFRMLHTVCRADAGYVAFTLVVRMLSAIAGAFLYVYLLGAVIYCVENGKNPERILLLLLAAMAFLAAVFALQSYYDNVFCPVYRERIAGVLQQELFHKLQAADMASYDSAELYTTVTLANAEIAVRPLEATENLFRGFEGLVAACTIVAGTLPANRFVLGICVVSFAAGACLIEKMETLSFQNVFFQYPDGTPGLKGIDLTIRKGSKIAIVGRNGSGKTTLIKLLLRFYDAASGSILQNGTDIRGFDVSSYRRQFGTAFQDFNIYAASLAENVCMGEEADGDRLLHALERAGLGGGREPLDTGGGVRSGSRGPWDGDGSMALDAQLTRELDERGILLSGGQLQRLVLARAFYRESDIIVMDEPTAAMDVFFEREFYRTVFEGLKDKTVIFVSHRLTCVTACDHIVYMEQGRILEEGTTIA